SCLNEGKTIKSNEIWEGSPAELIKTKSISELQLPLETKKIKKLVYYIIFSLLLFIFPFALLTPLLPVLILITELDNNANDYDFSYFIYMPLLSLIYIVLFSIQTIILTRLLQQNIKSGKYPIYSFTFLRKWLSDQLISLSLLVLHQIFATVYISTLFRLLGAKIGKYTEISTANNVSHTFLEIGSNSFIADNVTLGETDVRGQQLIIENTLIGSNSFVGNSALISQGYVLNDDMLIGVLSLPPNEEQTKIHKSKDWFGSPSIPLPRRQGSGDYDQSLTFRPTKLIWAARAIVELIRCILPETILLCCSTLFIAFIHDILIDYSWWEFIIYFPFYFLFFIGLPTLVFTLLLKWIFIGKYKPKHMPMWSKGVWFSEAITSIYESLAVPFFLEFTRGTPWLPFFMRLFGSKIGKKVYMDTTDITEFDMVELGDCVSLNEASGPQTHLFEDRVMKIGKIKIGSYSSVGTASIILYDTEIGENVNIGSLSLLMKGETLEKNTNWSGCPVKSN
ncbi:MAG: Pls/PosA family non-ribosomal peptide synthetase, partial [Candidatus Kapaibacterium sp.]